MKFNVLTVVLAMALTACDNQSAAPAASRLTEVGIKVLKAGPYVVQSELTGRTKAFLTAEVRPQVSGIIQQRLFKEGDEVTAGQPLYQIDAASYQASYNEAAAAWKNAKAAVDAACRKAHRYAGLVKVEGVSRQDAEDARATCEQDKASVAEKKAALETAEIDLQRTRIKAPISGRIGISSVTPGALVSAAQDDALATIRSLDQIYVDLTRSSADLLRLRKRALAKNSTTLNVSLTLEDGSTYAWPGKLALTEVAVDEETGSVTLRAIFPNPQHQLLPGMFVRARIDEGVLGKVILAPQQGITRDASGNATALVVGADNKVEKRSLVTEETSGASWLIAKGLHDGDRLIVEGVSKVTPGDKVNVVNLDENGEKN